MKKIGLILVVFAFFIYCPSDSQSQEVGDSAPDFSLVDVSGNEIRLGDFKEKKNVVLVFYADSTCRMAHGRLGELQKGISEIEKLNAEVIAISTRGNQDDVKISRMVQKITFTLIPKPNRKVVEDFGLKYDSFGATYATIIIDKGGIIRFKNVYDVDSASTIIKELQGIQ